MFICSNMDSSQKTGLNTGQTISFERGHPTLISATITNLCLLIMPWKRLVLVVALSMQWSLSQTQSKIWS